MARVPVSLVSFLRPEVKFGSVEDLQRQILLDEKACPGSRYGRRGGGIRAVLFDFDDTLQDRPRAFLNTATFFEKSIFPPCPPGEHAPPAHRKCWRPQ